MDYLELARDRHSIRKFTEEPVSQEDLDKIIVAANAAPVGSSRFEDVHLTVVRDRHVLDKLDEPVWARFADQEKVAKIVGDVKGDHIPTHGKMDIFYHAPVVIFVSHRKQDLQPNIEWANAACVAYSMHLEASSLGLGSVFMWGALESAREYPEYDHTDLLNLPEGFVPLIGLAIGHAAEVPPEREMTSDKLGVNYV